MVMQVASLEILEQAQFSQAQARAIARVLEADAATRREDLATKSDMKIALAELKIELKDDLRKTMATFSCRVYLAILAQLAVTISFTYYLLQGIKG